MATLEEKWKREFGDNGWIVFVEIGNSSIKHVFRLLEEHNIPYGEQGQEPFISTFQKSLMSKQHNFFVPMHRFTIIG